MPARLRRHQTQYFEMFGNRALYHDGWIASTVPYREPWNGTAPDRRRTSSTASSGSCSISPRTGRRTTTSPRPIPTKLKELQDLFWIEAAKYQVLPLDASALTRFIMPRPSIVAGRDEFTYTHPIVGVPLGTAPSILNKSFTITRRHRSA